jgi:8-amino-7-oxononanoate synthase
MNESSLIKALEKRREDQMLRSLRLSGNLVDFCSNDYLGFARSAELRGRINELCEAGDLRNGSTGSRLLSGNSLLAEQIEEWLAAFHETEACLLFNSGYDANIGFFSSVPQRGDILLYDELIHASIHDGRRLSRADTFRFAHNDMMQLESLLQKAKGTVYVALESVYSMDGDFAPLEDAALLCEKYGALLVVDEAHATGIFGREGRGLVQQLGLESRVYARIHTFGKALGCHGAIVAGSRVLKDYLVNFARSFIYTTALPAHSLLAVRAAYEMLPRSGAERDRLFNLIARFRGGIGRLPVGYIESHSPVQCLVIPGNENVRKTAAALQADGLDVRPILSPTVPKEQERLRICFHSYNTEQEVQQLLHLLEKITI